ncbi:MAG: type II toxin-antitoxin system RelB/DinJ family antitoxin [Synergistota bacterium]|nr:type II toxin-antitoxin system RelB/DinJ family antitoxin [Synergistota bacterium]
MTHIESTISKERKKDDVVRARVSSSLKQETGAILKELGLTHTDAIRLFLEQIRLREGLPFAIRIPNRRTIEAMREAQRNENLEEFSDADGMAEKYGW